MPRGIYPRSTVKDGGMKVVQTEAPVTPETANANVVEVVSQSGDESEMSTTERLFGDLSPQEIDKQIEANKPGPVAQSPEDEPETVEQPAPEEPKAPELPKAPEITDESFDIEKVLNKKVKAKIDGREEEVTLKELRDSYQINKHLAQAADKVGEERRKLADERRQIQEWRAQQQNGIAVNRETPEAPQIPNELNPLYAKINSLEQQLSQFVEGTKPALYQSNRQRVAEELKNQGFGDFLDFIPKMESHLLSLQDPQLVQFYDTPQGSKALYFQLKAQELNAGQSQPQPVPRGTQTQNIPVVPQTRVDSGAQASGSVTDDGRATYRSAFKRATQLGNDTPAGREAWNDVLMKKGIIPGD